MFFLHNMKPGRLALALVAACIALFAGVLPVLTADASAAQAKQTAFFSPNDPAIYYLGRVKREQSTVLTWPGSGFRVVYNNSTTVMVKLFANDFWEESTHNIAKMVEYRVDKGAWNRVIIGANAQQDVKLIVPGNGQSHQLDVIKVSEGQLTFQGLVLDQFGTLQPPTPPGGKIEVVGDSISAGYRVYGPASFEVPEDHDARASFGWLLGDRMGAEVRLIAVTGRGLVHNYDLAPTPGAGRTLPAYYPTLQRETDTPNDWSWQPAVVIVNVGTNDLSGPAQTPGPVFQGAYISLLAMIRQHNAGALIVAMQPFGLRNGTEPVYPQEIQNAVAQRKTDGDKAITYVNTAGWLDKSDFSDGVHPNVYGHSIAASHLAATIRNAMSASPVASSQSSGSAQQPAASPTPVALSTECPGSSPTRLAIGKQAQVIADGRGPSPVFDEPGGKIIGSVPEGSVVNVTDGPRCLIRSWFWLVTLANGNAGWMSENYRTTYFIQPAS